MEQNNYNTEVNTYGFKFDFAKVGFAAGSYGTGVYLKNKCYMDILTCKFDQDLSIVGGLIQLFCNSVLIYSVGMPSAVFPFTNASTFPVQEYMNNPLNAEIIITVAAGGIVGVPSLTLYGLMRVINADQ